MPDGQDEYHICRGVVLIQRNVAGAAAREQHLAQAVLDRSSQQGMRLERFEAADDERRGRRSQFGRLLKQEIRQAIEVVQRMRREDEPRHVRAFACEVARAFVPRGAP